MLDIIAWNNANSDDGVHEYDDGIFNILASKTHILTHKTLICYFLTSTVVTVGNGLGPHFSIKWIFKSSMMSVVYVLYETKGVLVH